MTTPKNNIIRQLRNQAGLTQSEVAERCEPQCGQTFISCLENEPHGPPTSRSVFRVATACGLDVTLDGDGWRISKKD